VTTARVAYDLVRHLLVDVGYCLIVALCIVSRFVLAFGRQLGLEVTARDTLRVRCPVQIQIQIKIYIAPNSLIKRDRGAVCPVCL